MSKNNILVMTRMLGMLVVMLPAACSHQPPPPMVEVAGKTHMPVDFSGSWERDYSKGGDINEGLKKIYRQLSRSAQYAGTIDGRYQPLNSSSVSMGAIIASARLADSISRSDLLEIVQGNSEIRVNREEDFTLTCEFDGSTFQQTKTAFGTELCGWDGGQMVFNLALPDGLAVAHRLTISPDKQELHVATTVRAGATQTPFSVYRYYTRIEPLPSKYDCVQTLSRKRVCTIRGAPQ
ncbi:MAG: hypothetical protein HKN70_05445 [Gammaproteobacteria bacterium]|nr:hypothetical protein [Gammaproteobacteria bacterium]